MPVEILGMISHRETTLHYKSPKIFDAGYLRLFAQTLEQAGYDRTLVAQSSFWPDSMPLAADIMAHTQRLKLMVAHRPGFVAPTMAARMFAALDHLSNGRAGIHIISAGNDAETQCDGDFLTKDERYHRSAEFVQILRAIWSSDVPVDHDGTYFKFKRALSEIRPLQQPSIPVYWGGSSEVSLTLAAQHADVYAFSLQSVAKTRDLMLRMQKDASSHQRRIAFQGGVRIILGQTEELAWRNARDIADSLRVQAEARLRATGSAVDQGSAGGRNDPAFSTKKGTSNLAKLNTLSDEGELIDGRLWTGTVTASGGSAPPAFVGTAEQITQSMMAYYELGVTGFMIRGFNVLTDVVEHGQELIPRLRAAVEAHDRTHRAA
ncbi:MAG: LLM class flavin-dependent oxidoreductase [Rhodospirillaceae bacterium]|nr:LLM class flavin-dependent oxidoreductase [Rhodospirillaceae bacterium]